MSGVTLVLGGGGFKGLAHLGVLLVLEEHEIPVERIVGASAGALVGASYCFTGDARRCHALYMDFVGSERFPRKSFRGMSRARGLLVPGGLLARVVSGLRRQMALERMFRRSSGFGGGALRHIVNALVPKGDVEDLPRPLAICALDLLRGEQVLLTSGHLQSAVVAASSVPGFFPPVERDGRLLCDAGIVNNLPTRLARELGAGCIVAVDLSAGLSSWTPNAMGMDVLFRAQDISTHLANRRWASDADVVLSPELDGRTWLDARDPVRIVAAGIEAAQAAVPRIRAVLADTSRRAS